MSKPIPKSAKAIATKASILDAATKLFWRHGFHAVAIDEIASYCAVNKATIYRYFPDKLDIGLQVVREQGRRILNGPFAEIFCASSAPDERLAALYTALICAQDRQFAEAEDVLGCPITAMVLELGYDHPRIRREAVDIFDQVEAHFHDLACESVAMGRADHWSAPNLARALMQLLHGGFVSARLAASSDPMRDAANASLLLIGSRLNLSITKGDLS